MSQYNIMNMAQDIFHIHTAKCMCTHRYYMSEELHNDILIRDVLSYNTSA